MPSVEVSSLVNEIRKLVPDVGKKKLHKLLYYIQGWHLTGAGVEAFSDTIAAYQYGPVVTPVWGAENHDEVLPPPQPLDQDLQATFDYVMRRYGNMSASQLEDLSHSEDPWKDAWAMTGFSDTITHKAMVTWFEEDPDRIEHRERVQRILESRFTPRVGESIENPRLLSAHERAMTKLARR